MSVNGEKRHRRSRRSRRNTRLIILIVSVPILISALATVVMLLWPARKAVEARVPRSLAERTGSVFLPAPRSLVAPPVVERVSLPDMKDAQPIWGATGRDLDGRIWFGVTHGHDELDAYLIQYDHWARTWRTSVSVGDQLRRLGLTRAGEKQRKIHSKIVIADDGWLYFASSDDEGEKDDGSAPPRWGSHLWRMQAGNDEWQHLMGVPEGLIAVGGAGRYVYALGYWGHVLYQYDTHAATSRKLIVGSVGGHVSRNLLTDVNGHVYVPRVGPGVDGKMQASLVEFDTQLQEVASTDLAFYLGPGDLRKNQGITGLSTLPDGRLVFTTSLGHLYQVEPRQDAPAKVTSLGWFHPSGEAYAPSLFAFGGSNLVAGVTVRENRHEWVVFEVLTRTSIARPLDLKGAQGVTLYGSQSRDDDGGCYLVGWANEGVGRQQPLILRVTAAGVPGAN